MGMKRSGECPHNNVKILNTIDVHFKMAKTVNFMLHIFYHN